MQVDKLNFFNYASQQVYDPSLCWLIGY
uniref:Uncharacterized protein n=1 Tax=Anguilla anguilla TaxID=7936 RepID=A0A0E9R870_ANGAN